MPELQALADELGPRGLELVTVLCDGRPERAALVAERVGLRAPIVIGDRGLMRRFNVEVYPWTVVIDRDGKAAAALRGAHDKAKLKREFERHL